MATKTIKHSTGTYKRGVPANIRRAVRLIQKWDGIGIVGYRRAAWDGGAGYIVMLTGGGRQRISDHMLQLIG